MTGTTIAPAAALYVIAGARRSASRKLRRESSPARPHDRFAAVVDT
jgi:hypothetical protein